MSLSYGKHVVIAASFILSLLVCTRTHGQSGPRDFTRYYEGLIDKKISISMLLSLQKDSFTGILYYKKYGKAIALDGKLYPDGTFEIKEYLEDRKTHEKTYTAMYTGKSGKDFNVLEGMWADKDGKKQLSFEVKTMIEVKTVFDKKYNIKSDIPQLTAAGAQYQDRLTGTLESVIQKSAQPYIKDYEEAVKTAKQDKNSADEVSRYSYTVALNDIPYYTDHFVSFVFHATTYEAGAHDNVDVLALNFRMKDGAATLLTTADLFQGEYKELLSSLCISSLKKQKASLVVNGSVKEKDIQSYFAGNAPFALTSTGISIIFSKGAIATPGEGIFEVNIPLEKLKSEKLKPVINPSGPLAR